MSDKLTGNVKWFDEAKGYGFIKQAQGKDVFVHTSELRRCGIIRPLRDGEQVSFTAEERPKGLFATQVTVTGG